MARLNTTEIGRLVRDVRKERELTQVELAELVNHGHCFVLEVEQENAVGILTRRSFTYADSWIEDGFPPGQSFPLSGSESAAPALNWFANRG